jgi:hypothetical protein
MGNDIKSKKTLIKYKIGVFLSFAIGGLIGLGIFVVWAHFEYGNNPLQGYVESIAKSNGGIFSIAYPIVIKWLLVSICGISLYYLYLRHWGRKY